VSQTLPPPLFDPFAPGFTDDPYPQYAALRAAAPVYQHPLGFWLLTCYDDVCWLLRAGLSVEDRNIAASPLVELREQMFGEEAARPGGVSMLDRDPPDHTRLRRLVSRAFTPPRVAALEPAIRAIADHLLDELDEADPDATVDLVERYAYPLPFAVIAELLGIPQADRPRLHAWFGVLLTGWAGDPPAEAVRASEGIVAYLRDLVDAKRHSPAADLAASWLPPRPTCSPRRSCCLACSSSSSPAMTRRPA